jgi:hypothetical protein
MRKHNKICYRVYFNHELLAIKKTKISAFKLARKITNFGDSPTIQRSKWEKSKYQNKTLLAGLATFNHDW